MDGPVMSRACARQIGRTGTVAVCGVQRARTLLSLANRKGYKGKVYGVEANPATVARLKKEVAGKVKVFHAALCAQPVKRVEFYLHQTAVSSSLVKRHGTVRSFPVPALTLAGLLGKTGPLDCLVLDIEGAEYGVLLGMTDAEVARVKSLCIELHPNLWPDPSADIAAHMATLGYIVTHGKSGHRPEISAVRAGKRDEGWQRYHDPAHPCHDALHERFDWVKDHIIGPRFLDVGCSNGVGLLVAAGLPGMQEVIGVDVNPAMVDEASANLADAGVDADVAVADAARLPYPNECFDTVLLGEVLEHVEDDRAALAEAARVLRRGGRVLITVPRGGHKTADHRRVYGACGLIALCETAALTPEDAMCMASGRKTDWLCLAARKA